MATFTLSEIRTRVNDITRDSGNTAVSSTIKDRIINDKVREFVDQTECNKNVLIFSLSAAATNGVKEYSKDGSTPTITYTDVEGWPYYVISSCDRIDKLSRWKGTSDDDTGEWREMYPVDQNQIDIEGLLDGSIDEPYAFETMGCDRFRILPQIASTGYTIKFKLDYAEAITEMTTDASLPSIPLKYRMFVIPGCIAEVFKMRGDARWQIYEAEYRANIQRIKNEISKDKSGRKPKLHRRYVGAGG